MDLLNMDFYEQYINKTDAEILEILKNREDYQDLAVAAAIRIALERKLIYSEQDLFAPEFQYVKRNRNKLFPEISNVYHRQKLAGSIFRFLYVISFLPAIFGFLKYAEGQLYYTYIGFGVSLIWFLLCFLLYKTRKIVVLIPMFILLFSILVIIGLNIFKSASFHVLDFVILMIFTFLTVYLLILLKKIIQIKSESE